MAAASAIEWTDATWNPIVGCSIVSPGCTNCYAMKMAARIEAMSIAETCNSHYFGTTKSVNGNPVWTGKLALAPDHILTAPLRWKKPRRIFVNSMGDLFHEDASDGWIMSVFEVMWRSPQHTFQILTKRPDRMRDFMRRWGDLSGEDFEPKMVRGPEATRKAHPSGRGQLFAAYLDMLLERSGGEIPAGAAWPTFDWAGGMIGWPDYPPNVWVGVSAERQKEADERIPILLQTPAAIRFVSCEPLLGPIDLTDLHPPGSHIAPDVHGWSAIWKGNAIGRPWLDWIIVGGESGPNARPMHPDWARSLRDQCQAAGVPYFFKQWGAWLPGQNQPSPNFPHQKVAHHQDGRWGPTNAKQLNSDNYVMWEPDGTLHKGPALQLRDFTVAAWAERVGKKRAGRRLDGRTWDEFPASPLIPAKAGTQGDRAEAL